MTTISLPTLSPVEPRMPSARLKFLVVLFGILTVGCRDDLPTASSAHPPLLAISDGAHGNGGNPHFYFLPPMVPGPKATGTFDPGLTPVVQIAGPNGFSRAIVASLASSGTHYESSWNTRGEGLVNGATYRIAIWTAEEQMGYADVVVDRNRAQLRGVDPTAYVPLVNGQTLPIKFVIQAEAISGQPKWGSVGTSEHTCGVTSSGTGYCWGSNQNANLGTGSSGYSRVPIPVAGGYSWQRISVSAHNSVSCGLTVGQNILCWGTNVFHRLGIGSQNEAQIALSPQPIDSENTWQSVGTGLYHACGVNDKGEVYCWGNNEWGQLGTGGELYRSAASPALGAGNFSAQSIAPMTASETRTCGLDVGGLLHCWGRYRTTPFEAGDGRSWADVSIEDLHSCGVSPGGEGYCWGEDNAWGQLGNGSSCSWPQTCLTPPSAIVGGLRWKSIRVAENYGGAFSCGLTTAGVAYCWGANPLGTLGIGTPEGTQYFNDQMPFVPEPTPVQTALRFKSIAVGTSIKWFDPLPVRAVVCGVTLDDNLYCWGDNTYGQLGDGTTVLSTRPIRVLIK